MQLRKRSDMANHDSGCMPKNPKQSDTVRITRGVRVRRATGPDRGHFLKTVLSLRNRSRESRWRRFHLRLSQLCRDRCVQNGGSAETFLPTLPSQKPYTWFRGDSDGRRHGVSVRRCQDDPISADPIIGWSIGAPCVARSNNPAGTL